MAAEVLIDMAPLIRRQKSLGRSTDLCFILRIRLMEFSEMTGSLRSLFLTRSVRRWNEQL